MVDQMTNAGVGFKVVVLCLHPMKSALRATNIDRKYITQAAGATGCPSQTLIQQATIKQRIPFKPRPAVNPLGQMTAEPPA